MSTFDSLNKLTKWRAVFAGWQLGTRLKDDAECNAVRDHREVTILLRAEVSALINILVEHTIVTAQEWEHRLGVEAEALSAMYAQKFPGMTATEDGITYTMPEAAETMKGWRP